MGALDIWIYEKFFVDGQAYSSRCLGSGIFIVANPAAEEAPV